MRLVPTVSPERVDELSRSLARKLLVAADMVLPFAEFDDLMPELLKMARGDRDELLSIGHASPDIAVAADRADLKVREQLGVSPFSADTEAVRGDSDLSHSVLYVANPNRVTGANFGLADLESLAQRVSEGWLIVDEYYYDYFGITAIPLLDKYPNVLVLRSFTASFGINSSNAGYLVASAQAVATMRENLGFKTVSNTLFRTISLSMDNDGVLGKRLKELHDETLRVATGLNHLGIQSRITAADFLLLRVNDPASVGNFLARWQIPIENLDGYPQLQKYMRYRVQSYQSNDKFLEACRKMPVEYIKGAGTDRRSVMLRKAAGSVSSHGSKVSPDRWSRVKSGKPELAGK